MSGNVLWPYSALGHLLNTLQYELVRVLTICS